ncbi:MAG: arsenate reductase ArsC [Acidobacteriota bacterium]|nr:arsenate reductase ArsC [Acidobacteriota bacterium]
MQKETKVLFLSIRNSVRAQMAEGFLRALGGGRFISASGSVESAEGIHPVAAAVMAEDGIDITTQHPKNVGQWFRESFSYVITLADQKSERAPLYPFTPRLLHWNVRDPLLVKGSREEEKQAFRQVRDEIKAQVLRFASQTVKR